MRPEGYDYDTHSRLAGLLTEPGDKPYRVQYRSLLSREPHRMRAVLLMTLAPILTGLLLVYLVWPTHWVEREGGDRWLVGLDIAMLVSIGLIELFMVTNVASVAHATMVARDPVPVVPEYGTRVAFLTTYVPGKEPISMVRDTLEAAVRLTHTGPLDIWLLDEGDDEQAKALCTRARGAPLLPQRRPRVEPRERRPQGPHQARQLQRLDRDARRRLRLLRLRRHRPRPAPQLPGADDGLLPRPRRRLRRRTAGVRELRLARHQGRRIPAVPLPRADPAGRQPLPGAHVRRHQQRRTDRGAAADRRPVRLDHRGHGHRLRTAPAQEPEDRPPLALRVHPGRAGRGRGPGLLDRLLHPADALVARHLRDAVQAVLEGALQHAARPAALVHPDARLLPDDRRQLAARDRQLRAVPLVRGVRNPGHRLGLADALQRRGRPPDRALPLEPAAQRLPARTRGLGRARRDGHVGALGTHLPQVARLGGAAHPRPVRRHPQGRPGQPRPAVDLPHPPVLGGRPRRLADRLRPLPPHPRRHAHLGRARPVHRARPRRDLVLDDAARARRRPAARPRSHPGEARHERGRTRQSPRRPEGTEPWPTGPRSG